MEDPQSLVVGACLLTLILGLLWARQLGVSRGLGAAACRLLWLAPLILAFFPRSASEALPRSLSLTPIHVLVDDSTSMTDASREPLASTSALLAELHHECTRIGCSLQQSLLSQLDPLTQEGYTPLSRVLESWLAKVGGDPWLLLSDGGDFEPMLPWVASLKDAGRSSARAEPRGLIVSFAHAMGANIRLEAADLPPFSFEGKPLAGQVALAREGSELPSQNVQVQALLGGKTLATSNGQFAAEATTTDVLLTLPPLPRGRHLITVKALAPAGEAVTWDNQTSVQVEVMPNTVGVLHLLGSPSWDGRFLRRYLKSEPKYDLISFYILRDPWDSQAIDERELSLIPFPVARLFNEELPNFRVIVLQNFTLLQFLQPEYQQNLVKFVKEGGGLLFLGGDRALLDIDIRNSPLREILPFATTDAAGTDSSEGAFYAASGLMDPGGSQTPNKSGPWYEADLAFRIGMATPTSEERALANVYDDWRALAPSLTPFPNARGLHHMENVHFKAGAFTPLLTATTPTGQSWPLAIASYPGKGRAIWLFSDSIWRTALEPSLDTSRDVYPRFMQAAMTWLLRNDLRKPLLARDLVVRRQAAGRLAWQVTLQGPAVRYFSSSWQVHLCGQRVEAKGLMATPQGNQSMLLNGSESLALAAGERCLFEVRAENAAFGSVSAAVSSLVPTRLYDEQVKTSASKLQELAQLSGARLLPYSQTHDSSSVHKWLASQSAGEGLSLPAHYQILLDHYWHLTSSWLWLLLLFMPCEVLLRRWPEIMWGRKQR